jgi:hypothetical protein
MIGASVFGFSGSHSAGSRLIDVFLLEGQV